MCIRDSQDTEQVEHVGQFNLIGFVDDLSLFTQTLGGAHALLEAIQEFELWSGLKVNRKKTCAMIIEQQGSGQCQTDETLIYMGQKVALLAPSVACRYLGVWGTPTGDMSVSYTHLTLARLLPRNDHRTCFFPVDSQPAPKFKLLDRLQECLCASQILCE